MSNELVQGRQRGWAGGWGRAVGVLVLGVLGLVVFDGVRRTGTGAGVVEVRGAGVTGVAAEGRLRVATFNVASGVGRDGKFDLGRTVATLKEAGADVVVLNEVRGEGQQREIEAAVGAGGAFVPTERRWWREDFGNGLLVGPGQQVEGVLRVPMPQTQERGWRNVVVTRVKVGEKVVTVLGTHVDRRADQGVQLAFLKQLFLSTREPVILMGDMNVSREHPVMKELLATEGVVDCTEGPPGCIEFILGRGVKVVNRGVVEKGASDHPLRWAEVVP